MGEIRGFEPNNGGASTEMVIFHEPVITPWISDVSHPGPRCEISQG